MTDYVFVRGTNHILRCTWRRPDGRRCTQRYDHPTRCTFPSRRTP